MLPEEIQVEIPGLGQGSSRRADTALTLPASPCFHLSACSHWPASGGLGLQPPCLPPSLPQHPSVSRLSSHLRPLTFWVSTLRHQQPLLVSQLPERFCNPASQPQQPILPAHAQARGARLLKSIKHLPNLTFLLFWTQFHRGVKSLKLPSTFSPDVIAAEQV